MSLEERKKPMSRQYPTWIVLSSRYKLNDTFAQ